MLDEDVVALVNKATEDERLREDALEAIVRYCDEPGLEGLERRPVGMT